MNEGRLIENILSRDQKALRRFYKTYAPKLRGYICTKIHNRADAEEVLQDTLYAFLEAIRDFEGESKLQTFLYAICNNKIVDFYRKKRVKTIVFSQIPQLEKIISSLMRPEKHLDNAFLEQKIAETFAKLIPKYRNILLLKYVDNLSVRDIAKKLSISFKSAESRLFRARRAFAEVFAET